jgi:hypothetical protein
MSRLNAGPGNYIVLLGQARPKLAFSQKQHQILKRSQHDPQYLTQWHLSELAGSGVAHMFFTKWISMWLLSRSPDFTSSNEATPSKD